MKSQIKLKTICLGLQCLTHLIRMVYYSVDPFLSQNIFPFLVSYELLTGIATFEIATNILLSYIL